MGKIFGFVCACVFAVACYTDEEQTATPDVQEEAQEINGRPNGDVCILHDMVPCWTPQCQEDCDAPRYFCCEYGNGGFLLGCGYIVDGIACGGPYPV